MIKPDNRIAALASFVRHGVRICDVGTDHAILPCFLWQQGEREVFASDINDGPLLSAAETVRQYGCEGVRLIKSDGLKNVPPCDDIIIAGMGGELIMRIILECGFVDENTRFILQPMTKAEYLRRELYRNGYEIIAEKGASSAGRAYSVMHVRFTGEKAEISDEFAFFGKNSDKDYTETVNRRLEKQANGNPEYLKIIRKVTAEDDSKGSL